MAGNVKEWCWNEERGGRRFILGGGFGEPSYMFRAGCAVPRDRRPNFGFRCENSSRRRLPSAAARKSRVPRLHEREAGLRRGLRAFRGLYAYDKGELNARVEETAGDPGVDPGESQLRGGLRARARTAYLYLPKNASPPFRRSSTFPARAPCGWTSWRLRTRGNDFVPKSGRALMVPIYKGTFERRDGPEVRPSPSRRLTAATT